MPQFLLDTNAASDILRAQPEPTDFIDWLERNVNDCFLSAITLHELEFGVARLALRKAAEDRLRSAELARVNGELILMFAGRILPVRDFTLVRAGTLRARAQKICGNDIGLADAIVAATADIRGLFVVTRNAYQLCATGVRVIDGRNFLPSLEWALSTDAPMTYVRALRAHAQKIPPATGRKCQFGPELDHGRRDAPEKGRLALEITAGSRHIKPDPS